MLQRWQLFERTPPESGDSQSYFYSRIATWNHHKYYSCEFLKLAEWPNTSFSQFTVKVRLLFRHSLPPTPGVDLFLEGEHRNEQYWSGRTATFDIEAICIYANSFKKVGFFFSATSLGCIMSCISFKLTFTAFLPGRMAGPVGSHDVSWGMWRHQGNQMGRQHLVEHRGGARNWSGFPGLATPWWRSEQRRQQRGETGARERDERAAEAGQERSLRRQRGTMIRLYLKKKKA